MTSTSRVTVSATIPTHPQGFGDHEFEYRHLDDLPHPMTGLDVLTNYLADRAQQRRDAVHRILNALTDREQQLVREATVMGYVEGVYAAQAGNYVIPDDTAILHQAIDACLAHPDLYLTITATAEEQP